MPDPCADVKDHLDHIKSISQNARTTWFGLLGLLTFVGVTLMAHNDANFFALGVETKLPLIGIAVPTTFFFVGAPVLVAAVYGYFHLYLLGLWDALADAPQEPGAAPLSDRVFPWLINTAALWYRNRYRNRALGRGPAEDGSASPRVLGRITLAVVLILSWVFGLFILGAFWRSAMPVHNLGLTLVSGVCLWFAVLVGATGLLAARGRLLGQSREAVAALRPSRWAVFVLLGALIGWVSWEKSTGGPLWDHSKGHVLTVQRDTGGTLWLHWLNAREARLFAAGGTKWKVTLSLPLSIANLREAPLTPRPKGWQGYDFWRQEQEDSFRKRHEIKGDLSPKHLAAFWADIKRRWTQRMENIAAPDLKQADLRLANLREAFLPNADLRGANLTVANLEGAALQGARMECWREEGEEDACTKLQGAALKGARMQGAVLEFARMQGADLRFAQMQGADLTGAQMQRADLELAEMQGADLTGAQMQRADLELAQMQRAVLELAEMQGAVLELAEMQNADCRAANFSASALQSAIILCSNLGEDALQFATGNDNTRLPMGRHVMSCLSEDERDLPGDLRTAIAHHPETSDNVIRITRVKFLERILCDPDQVPERIEGKWSPRDDGSWVHIDGTIHRERPDGRWIDIPPGAAAN